MSKSTSFRMSDRAKAALVDRASAECVSATALLEELIVEGVAARDFPGVVYRGPRGDRRAALAAGPDVWEVVSRLQDLRGSDEHRIRILSEESQIPTRLLRVALDFAAAHPDEITARIERNRRAAEASKQQAVARRKLLAG